MNLTPGKPSQCDGRKYSTTKQFSNNALRCHTLTGRSYIRFVGHLCYSCKSKSCLLDFL